ncbi:MAG: DUF3794 domain-containing protein [Oscillospiraceae bacterium]|nr:DUF3794 domain-containing protein [Oscillospiraceae bacterium]
MDLQFPKTRHTWLAAASHCKELEQTLELKLPDNMPDIGKVVCAWGQSLLRSKQWNRDGAGVSGGVMVWVMYLPEDGSEARCVEGWLPFQARWEVADKERDGVIVASCYLSGVDGRSLSARKLMVRANVALAADTFVETEAQISSPGELPEDVQLKLEDLQLRLPVEAGEKTVELDETILPPAGVKPDKLLSYSLHPRVTDCKLMADRAVFRGTAQGHGLYLGEDGQLHSWDFQVPFSQYGDLDREYGAEDRLQVTMVLTGLEMELTPEGGARLKGSMQGQYVLWQQRKMQLVTDAYSTKNETQLQQMPLELPRVTAFINDGVTASAGGVKGPEKALEWSFFPVCPAITLGEDGLQAELAGSFQALGMEDGSLTSQIIPWQGSVPLPPGQQGSLRLCLSGPVDSQAELSLEGWLMDMLEVPMVTGIAVNEPLERRDDRPSMILRRAGEDSLWDIAKANATTVEKIMEANALTQEPQGKSWLLIPMP